MLYEVITDLTTGESKLIVPISKVKDIIHSFTPEDLVYFNHTLISKNGTKVFWLARTLPSWKTTALTANMDGTNIQRCFPDEWGGSHFDWLNDNELRITSYNVCYTKLLRLTKTVCKPGRSPIWGAARL